MKSSRRRESFENPVDPNNPISDIPLVQFTNEEGQVERQLITNEKYVIQVDAEKTIEKHLKVPNRPLTVEIIEDQDETSGVKGKKNFKTIKGKNSLLDNLQTDSVVVGDHEQRISFQSLIGNLKNP